jgi:DNA-directed RNA polymerase subunit RPC12/RpoP
MSEPGRRPILRLKNPPPLPTQPAPEPKPGQPPAADPGWKCKPCGARLVLPETWAGDDELRCPNCNAKIGLMKDIMADPPETSRLRARRVA